MFNLQPRMGVVNKNQKFEIRDTLKEILVQYEELPRDTWASLIIASEILNRKDVSMCGIQT